MTEEAAPPLELRGISKSFGGVAALRDVDFVLRAGEIHGLVGENGAGKSTLMKIIAGLHGQYDGRMAIDGRPVHFRSPREALAAGIGMVHQELSVVPDLTVAENVYLGQQPTKRRHRRLARHDGRCAPASRRPRHRRRSARAHGLAGDRPAAADRARPRAVLGRAHRHPRRADLGSVAARGAAPVRGAARRARQRPQHRLHLALPRRRSGDLRHRHDLPQRPAHRHRGGRHRRQGLADPAHDRPRPRGARRQLHRRDRARQPARRAGRPRRARARRRPRLRRRLARRQGRGGAWASTASWAAA